MNNEILMQCCELELVAKAAAIAEMRGGVRLIGSGIGDKPVFVAVAIGEQAHALHAALAPAQPREPAQQPQPAQEPETADPETVVQLHKPEPEAAVV